MMTHGAIDGYSRLILYLKCSTNNEASTVYSLFLSAVEKYQLPSRVRSDQGLENVMVARHMIQVRGGERHSMLTGSSTHNERIERLWRDMHKSATLLYYRLFYFMEHHGILNPLNEHHLYALQFVYLPRINNTLMEFSQSWNHHPIRTANHKSPNQLFTAGAILLQNSQLPGINFFHQVNSQYGIDMDGPLPVNNDQHVHIPSTSLNLTNSDLEFLKRSVDPCVPSDNYGIEFYEQALQTIMNF